MLFNIYGNTRFIGNFCYNLSLELKENNSPHSLTPYYYKLNTANESIPLNSQDISILAFNYTTCSSHVPFIKFTGTPKAKLNIDRLRKVQHRGNINCLEQTELSR